MLRRATSLAEKIHYYAFNLILMVSLVISPLYYAGVLSVSPAAAKEADAPAAAVAASVASSPVDSYTSHMADLPPLAMADASTEVNAVGVASSAVNSVAAQSSGTVTDVFASEIVDTHAYIGAPNTVTFSNMIDA